MSIPVIAWKNISDLSTASVCDYKTVDAGSDSAPQSFFLTNNWGGSTATSSCEGAKVTTKSNTGSMSDSVVVSEKWVSVKNESASETNYTQVGGNYNSGTSSWEEVALNVCADYSGISGAVVSATQPASPTAGMIWVKTSALGNSTYRYNAGTSTFDQIYEISGAINSGTVATAKPNLIRLTTMASVPSASLAGTYTWKLRLRYSFV